MTEWDRASLPLLSQRPSPRASGSAGAAGWEEEEEEEISFRESGEDRYSS